jgi:hypothetical protein
MLSVDCRLAQGPGVLETKKLIVVVIEAHFTAV